MSNFKDLKIEVVDELHPDIEDQMTDDLIDYEAERGIDLNFEEFSLVLRKENEVIGVLTAYTAFAEIYIDDLWIDNKYRGKGYGKHLVHSLEEMFSGKGFNNINLVTSDFQAPKFYEKCGFTPEFRRINKKNPQLSKTFFVKFFNEENQYQGLLDEDDFE